MMINSKLLLFITFIIVAITYYMLFSISLILTIIKEEYITMLIIFLMMVIYFYFRYKLKDKLLYEFIPNINYVSLKSSILFFLIFEVVDYYSEDGLIGMIKLWFAYWLYGVLAYFLTHNINFYKNYKAYQNSKTEI